MAIAALCVSACNRHAETEITPTTTQTPPPADTTPAASPDTTVTGTATGTEPPAEVADMSPATTAPSQAQALAMLAALDEHEIAAAEQALSKNVTGKTLDFAKRMQSEHRKNLDATLKLGATDANAPVVRDLRSKGQSELRALAGKSGTDYETAYVDAMVTGHSEVLEILDETLMPAATDKVVRDHFTATRAVVVKHLDDAKNLQPVDSE